jgi:hypothetical protein
MKKWGFAKRLAIAFSSYKDHFTKRKAKTLNCLCNYIIIAKDIC